MHVGGRISPGVGEVIGVDRRATGHPWRELRRPGLLPVREAGSPGTGLRAFRAPSSNRARLDGRHIPRGFRYGDRENRERGQDFVT